VLGLVVVLATARFNAVEPEEDNTGRTARLFVGARARSASYAATLRCSQSRSVGDAFAACLAGAALKLLESANRPRQTSPASN